MANYGNFLEDLTKYLKELVHQYYGNGIFRDNRTGIIYKSGCLYHLDPTKVEFLSDSGSLVTFPLKDLEHFERVEDREKAMQPGSEPG